MPLGLKHALITYCNHPHLVLEVHRLSNFLGVFLYHRNQVNVLESLAVFLWELEALLELESHIYYHAL